MDFPALRRDATVIPKEDGRIAVCSNPDRASGITAKAPSGSDERLDLPASSRAPASSSRRRILKEAVRFHSSKARASPPQMNHRPQANQNEAIYSDIKKGKKKIKKDKAPAKKNTEIDFDSKSEETTQTAAKTEVHGSGSRSRLLLVGLGIICFLLCAIIIISVIYFAMETKKLKLNLSDLEAKTEQLTLEKRDLQNQTEDLRTNMTKIENQTQQMTAEKMFFKNQTMEMTVNMTILQNQNEQLRNNSDKLNRTQAAILKHPNLSIFCSDGVCQTCPKDWIQFQESCYFFYNLNSQWKTWDESRQFCQSNKSDLVVISSLEEQTFIYNTIEFYLDIWHGYWIGLQKVNNIWIWVDGSPDTLGYWKNPGSPEDFAIIAKDPALTQSWIQNRNGFLNKYICEIKAFIF